MKSAVSGQPDKSRLCVWVPVCCTSQSPPASERCDQDPGSGRQAPEAKDGGRPRRDRGGGYVVELGAGTPCRWQWLRRSTAGPRDIALCTRVPTRDLPKPKHTTADATNVDVQREATGLMERKSVYSYVNSNLCCPCSAWPGRGQVANMETHACAHSCKRADARGTVGP